MKIEELKSDPLNPRKIEDAAIAGLKTSLGEFGDLSGITWNKRTGYLVAGHQRLRALQEEHGDALQIEGETIVTPSGESFKVRVVDWDEGHACLANIAANSPMISGEFTENAVVMLGEIEAEFPDLSGDLLFPELKVDLEGAYEWPAEYAAREPVIREVEALNGKEPL